MRLYLCMNRELGLSEEVIYSCSTHYLERGVSMMSSFSVPQPKTFQATGESAAIKF